MVDLAKLTLRLEADNKSLTSSLEKTTRQLQGFQRTTQSITSSVRSALGTLGLGFSTVALVRSLGTTIDFADNMGKLSQKTGVAVEELSALNYAAQLSDVSTDSLATAFKKLAVNQSDALKGTGEAKDAFAAIGVTLADLKTKSPDQLLKQISDRFASYEDGANKAALAVKLFGRAGTDLIPLLNQGSAGIARGEAEARRFGATVDEKTAAAAERFNDQMKALSTTFTGFKIAVASDILPALNQMTAAFTTAYQEGFTLKRFMNALKAEGGGGKFADPNKVFNAEALRDNLRELQKEYDATQQKLAKGFYFDTDTKELNIPAANRLALDALGKQIIDTKSQLRDLIGMQTPVNNVGKEILKLNDYWQLNAISTKEYIALVQKAAGVKTAAPEIKSTTPTKAEKALDAEIEKIQKANKEWQAGILTVQQYHDAVRQAADLPNKIQGVDALKPIDNSSAIGQQLSALADSLKTPEDLEGDAYEARKKLAEQNITDAEARNKVLEDLEARHQATMIRLRSGGLIDLERYDESSWQNRLELAGDYGVALLSAAGQINDKLFKAAQIAGAGQAFVSTLVGESKALELGWPMGPIAALKIAATGLGFVAAIKAAHPGGGQNISAANGGGIPGSSLSGSYVAPTSTPKPQTIVQVYIQDNYGWDAYVQDKVIAGIRQAVDKADVVLISGNSRQAQEIRSN